MVCHGSGSWMLPIRNVVAGCRRWNVAGMTHDKRWSGSSESSLSKPRRLCQGWSQKSCLPCSLSRHPASTHHPFGKPKQRKGEECLQRDLPSALAQSRIQLATSSTSLAMRPQPVPRPLWKYACCCCSIAIRVPTMSLRHGRQSDKCNLRQPNKQTKAVKMFFNRCASDRLYDSLRQCQ